MPDLTTARRLAEYRDDLLSAGFTVEMADELVRFVAPNRLEEVKTRPDLDAEPPPHPQPARRTVRAVGGLLRVEDVLANGDHHVWADSDSIRVDFHDGDPSDWTIYQDRAADA
jgi:hypothetical protein